MTVSVQTHRFTVEDFHRMVGAGILKAEDRVELVEGELVEMTPIGPDHAVTVLRLNTTFSARAGSRALVNVRNPLRLGPQIEVYPDIVLLRPPIEQYAGIIPGPRHVFLVIEVSDTALEYDRGRKLALYARASIPEVWIVDLEHAQIEVFTNPSPEGYGNAEAFRRGSHIDAASLPGLAVSVNEILP